jgi:putative Mg2+ transporter-C (MgtC) family protein
MLVALAAAVFMIVSVEFPFTQRWESPTYFRSVDPSKIAASVVAGIGFLGAGAIFRRGGLVQGMTTAAELWLVTAVGLAAGAGLFVLAGAATGLALFVLIGLHQVEKWGYPHRLHRRRVVLVSEAPAPARGEIAARLKAAGIELESLEYDHDLVSGRTRLSGLVEFRSPVDETSLLAALEGLPGARRVGVRRPGASE